MTGRVLDWDGTVDVSVDSRRDGPGKGVPTKGFVSLLYYGRKGQGTP